MPYPINQLRVIVKRKMDILLGDQLELKRQQSELDRLDSFVEYQMSGDPTQLLFGWSRQSRMRALLHDFAFFRETVDVGLDVKVTGGIAVMIDEEPGSSGVAGRVANSVTLSPKKNVNTAVAPAPERVTSLKKVAVERRTVRRVSDLFAETMGEYDQFSLVNDTSF